LSLQGFDLVCEGQSGMDDVAIDPDFNSNRLVYVYVASGLSIRFGPDASCK